MSVVGTAVLAKDNPVSAREGVDGAEITLRYKVMTNNALDSSMVVLGAQGVPGIGAGYQIPGGEYNPYLQVVSRIPKKAKKSSFRWWVDVEYRSPRPEERQQSQSQQGDPLFDIPQVQDVTIKDQVDSIQDRDDEPYVNKAGEAWKPHPKKDESRRRLTITRNESILSPIQNTKDDYIDRLNADVFWSKPAERWKCQSIDVNLGFRLVRRGNASIPMDYLIVTYVFESKVRAPYWAQRMPNSGFNYKTGNLYTAPHPRAGQPILAPFTTEGGREYEWWLDVDGEPGLVPYYIDLNPYTTVAFGPLNLPQNFLAVLRGNIR